MNSLNIELLNINFSYNDLPVFKSKYLNINKFPTALIGPNGCGKTTLLKLLAGLIAPREGRIVYYPTEFFLGYLPQFPIYLPWYRVYKNILKVAKGDCKDPYIDFDKFIMDFNKENSYKYPHQLSGGNLQKLNIILVIKSLLSRNSGSREMVRLLLLDEPLKSLDLESREAVIRILNRLIIDGIKLIFVAHDNEIISRLNTAEIIDLA